MKSQFRYWWIAVWVVLFDQATKLRVRHTMELWDSIPVIGDFFRLTYVTNHGGAFSLSIGDGSYNQLFFTIATLIAMLLIVYLITKTDKTLPLVAYWLVLGGAIGNIIDRFAYGYVIDFLDFDFFNIIIERWPVFNVADSAITIAIIILLIDLFFFTETKKEVKDEEVQFNS